MPPTEILANSASSTINQHSGAVIDEVAFVPVNLPPLTELCDKHAIDPDAILRFSWSLVLGIYSGASVISFRCVRRRGSDYDSPYEECLHQMSIGRALSMAKLLEESNNLYQRYDAMEHSAQNLDLDGCDAALVHGTEMGSSAVVLRRSEMANVSSSYDKSLHMRLQWLIYLKIRLVLEITNTTISLGYKASKLGALQATSMAAAVRQVITTLIHEPLTLMSDVDWCSREDKNILSNWNPAQTTWVEECVHDSISATAATQPDRAAVDAWDGKFTYCELDNLSSTLAVHLTDVGVIPGTFVGLYFEKSKWLVVSILAVIKTGAAYVVIEPYYPPQRMEDICSGLQLVILLASQDSFDAASKLCHQVVLVGPSSEFLHQPCQNERSQPKLPPVSPRNALYVVFSSGSTGKPKAIIVEHAAFVTWCTMLQQSLSLDNESRVLQFSSFAFLIAHRDVLLTLLCGGCVCMPSEKQRLNHLETFIAEHRVSWANLTPSVATLLNPAMTPGLKTLLLTSEPMSLRSLARWEGRVNLMFAYGQSETVSLCCVRRSPTVGSDRKNVGHRVGRSIWLVDPEDHDKLVPVGAVGELVIQGPVLARGYLDSERTALAFLGSTAWLQQLQPAYSGRLYKTGDLAQFAEDGSVRYLGRKDNSTKLYGQRLDLDEVLQHVQRCLVETSATEVCDVVVDLSQTAHSEDIKLTAFLGLSLTSADTKSSVVLGPLDQAITYLQTFQSRLSSVVPSHMIPTLVVIVSHIPLNLSGKIDRRNLREVVSQLTVAELALCMGSTVSHEAPRTERELELRSLWSQVLGISESSIGRLDNFFRRGGDSLTAMKLASAAHSFGLCLTFGDIFANPVLSEQADLINSTRQETAMDYSCAPFELITHSQKQAVIETAAAKYAVSASQIEDIYPTTPLQEGLLALNTIRPGSYVSQRVLKLDKDASLHNLEIAWRNVVDSTQSLRTRIIRAVDDGSTYQVVVRGELAFDITYDLKGYLENSKIKAMGLGTSLLRLALIPTASGESGYCVVTVHHCIYDAWSMALLLAQVSDAYSGETLPLQTFRQFVNYVGQSNESSSEYWRSELAEIGVETFPSLPAPAYSPSITASEIRDIRLPTKSVITGDITLATRIQLAWAMTLATYTGVDDVIFGLTVSGRASPVHGIDKLAGPTIATIPLRVHLRPSSPIKDELEALQGRVVAAIPFEQFGLQNISRLGEDAAKACKFQSLLVIQQSDSLLPGQSRLFSDAEGITVRPTWDTYALSLLCTPSFDGGIRIEAFYDSAVVAQDQMRRILKVFVDILMQTMASPHTLVGDIDSINREDLEQIQIWNSALPPAVPMCIHDMINEHCVSQPEAIAIDAWDGQFTYKDLDELSSHLCVSLRHKGLGQDSFVPICSEKSKWVAVAILAVAKVGSAFILLDPSHPAERLAWICENAKATVVLCSRNTAALAAKFPCQNAMQVAECCDRNTQSSPMIEAIEPTQALPHDALCALYTSGSTGTPKGVIIEHSAFATQATALGPHFHLDRHARIFQFASHAFDVAVSDYILGLALGGCICVPKEEDSRNNLAAAMHERKANWAFLTPSVARTLNPLAVPNIQTLVLGGESAKGIDFATWSDAVRLIYVYGPAEGTVYCTVQRNTQVGANPTHIGAPVAAACWLARPTDPEKLVAIGAVGELVMEGPIVGRYYIGDDTDSSSFISAPKWLRNLRHDQPLNRLYRTGDLMRYSAAGDGSLEFVGRKDRQVKLRGQRMELSEIEHQVSRHFPCANDAVVEMIASADAESQRMLAAFIWDGTTRAKPQANGVSDKLSTPEMFLLPDNEFKSRVSTAKLALRQSLPSFMIPSLFIPLKQLPLGATGKANRRLLNSEASLLSQRQLSIYQAVSSSEIRSPSNELESKVHQLVAAVLRLNVNEIGMNDNFFQLGGDSISAMILSARANDSGLALAAADILGHPRLDDMTKVAMPMSMNGSGSSTVQLPPNPFSLLPTGCNHKILMHEVAQQCQIDEDGVEDIYPCTPLQEGLFALTMKQPTAYVFTFTLQLTQDIDIIRFEESWTTVIAANPILRTRIACANSAGGHLVQVILRETHCSENFEEAGPYFLELGRPLLSVRIAKGESGIPCQAVVTLHHALYDAVSLRLILTQLSEAYYGQKIATSQPYSCFIQHCLSLPCDNEMRKFWTAELQDATGSIFKSAPMDSYVLQSPSYAECVASISSEITASVPLSAALKLAWGITVSTFIGDDEAIFGTVVSGRMANVAGIHKIVGPTIATVPVRVRHIPTMTIQEALEEVQSQSLRMIRFEQTGLQRLRQLGYADACRFQSLLIIQSPEEEDFPESPLYKIVLEESSGAFHTYPLTIVCTSSGQGVHMRATFDAEIIPITLANRLLMQYEVILRCITTMPGKPLSSIHSQSADDAKRIWAWNEIVPEKEGSCVHDIITNRVAVGRDSPAVCAWDGDLTYGELDDKSTKLAVHLVSLSISIGTVVPLCFEKSKWAIVALLAVLKAGGTFVPLDVAQAQSRRDSILARIGARVILASAKQATVLASTQRTIFVVDETTLSDLPLQVLPALPSSTATANELLNSAAYIFFTSGSTGEPKGVAVNHGALSTSCLAHGARMGFNEKTRMLQFTSYTFDISLAEILTTLIYGGCVCVPSEADRFSGLELCAEAMHANSACLTASVARFLEPDRMPSLKTIIFVGENATDDDFEKWMHLEQVFDAYGPTECTIFCSINELRLSRGAGSVIGKAVGAVSWVVSPSDHNRLMPIGAIGELLVEGPVLAHGYFGDVEKTAAVFVEDPPWLVHGAPGFPGRSGRLYKTGDLVQYSENGNLKYLGRKDTQVKIRGHRVEVGEVESHLIRCIAGAKHAVVVPFSRNTEDAGSQLVAFLSFDNDLDSSDTGAHAITLSLPTKDSLADCMTAYMLPSVYLAIGRLPLNTSGKLDRKRLQNIAADYFQKHTVNGNAEPQNQPRRHLKEDLNETEERVRATWATVLGLSRDSISIRDNFYDIGGDSIRIIRLMKLIQTEFGTSLGSSLVNSRRTTISKMAEYIETRTEVDTILDLEGDIKAALGSPWSLTISEPWFKPVGPAVDLASVFLTGATGFLGTQILRSLLASSAAKRVAVLVRASSVSEGMERLKETASIAEWWKDEYAARIDAWVGDLALVRLGLTDAQWSQLSGTAVEGNISAIIHNGAIVNWNMDYHRLRLANVLSTVELLKAATVSHASPRFVHVSGGIMSDLDPSPGNTTIMEKVIASNGYSQSKFVAEAIVRRFAIQLPPSQNRFSVVKPGMIIGAADAGVANVDDFIWRIVATASRLQLYPEDAEDGWIPITDAGFVASRIVAQVLADDKVSPYVSIASEYGLGAAEFWEQVNSELKHACEPVSWPVWIERALLQTDQQGESHPLWPVQEFLRARTRKQGGGISTLVPLAPPDREVLCNAVRANVRYLGRVGFLECRQSNGIPKTNGVLRRSAATPALNI